MLSRLRLWPVIDARQSFTHKRSAISLRKTVGNAESLDPLLIGQQPDRSGPVGSPHAPSETESVENAGNRIPDVLVREGLVRQCARAADFDRNVIVGAARQQLRQIGKWLRRRWRFIGVMAAMPRPRLPSR